MPIREVLEDVGRVVFKRSGLAELADIGSGALAGEQEIHLAGDGLFLRGIENGLDDHGELGVAGLHVLHLEGLEREGELFVARGAAPEDAHDGKAVGLADVCGEFDLALGHGRAVGIQNPLDDGLDFAAGLDVGRLGGHHSETGAGEGVFHQPHTLVDEHVGKADSGVGSTIPWECVFAEVRRVFAAGVVLSWPEAEALVVVEIFARPVVGGVGFRFFDEADDF